VALLPSPATRALAMVGTDPALEEAIRARLPSDLGTFGVAVVDLRGGRTAYVNPDEVFETASLYKLFVMVELFRQRQQGTLSFSERGITANLEAMITVSDNDAAEALWRRVGIANINATMRRLGLPRSQVAYVSTTTPREMSYLLERIALLRVVDAESSAEMIRVMGRQRINDRLPVGLPEGTYVAHKTGDLGAMTHDAGIVFAPFGPFVIVTLNKDTSDVYASRTVESDVARAAYEYLEGAPQVTPDPPLVFDPRLDEAVRGALPEGYGVAVRHVRTGQAALVGVDDGWPRGDPNAAWGDSARDVLLWLARTGTDKAPRTTGVWHGLQVEGGAPGADDLVGGEPGDVWVAHRFTFDGYTALDAGLVFAPGGPYTLAVVSRGDGGAQIGTLSRQVYRYFAEQTWAWSRATGAT